MLLLVGVIVCVCVCVRVRVCISLANACVDKTIVHARGCNCFVFARGHRTDGTRGQGREEGEAEYYRFFSDNAKMQIVRRRRRAGEAGRRRDDSQLFSVVGACTSARSPPSLSCVCRRRLLPAIVDPTLAAYQVRMPAAPARREARSLPHVLPEWGEGSERERQSRWK